jgi:uncharacterized protein (DUF427 family)
MPKAIWNNVVVAESDKCELVEGNCYFPPESIKKEYFRSSQNTSVCSWKGLANYYSLEVDGKQNQDAAWFYENPKQEAANIKGYIAFWKGVVIER